MEKQKADTSPATKNNFYNEEKLMLPIETGQFIEEEIEGNKYLTFRISVSSLQNIIDGTYWLNYIDKRQKITDFDEFAKELRYALNHEDEQGSTVIHYAIDNAIKSCIENGAFGIEDHEEQEENYDPINYDTLTNDQHECLKKVYNSYIENQNIGKI